MHGSGLNVRVVLQKRPGAFIVQQLVVWSKTKALRSLDDATWTPLRHNARTGVAATLTE
jgi:hypothetical protein